MTEAQTNSKQAALPGLEPGEPDVWIVTVEDHGLEYTVAIEAMTRREAREIFQSKFDMYELGVEDDEFDRDHETVFARSDDDAEEIALSRTPDEIGREYMRAYDTCCLGNSADVVSAERADQVDGWKSRRAQREREVVR